MTDPIVFTLAPAARPPEGLFRYPQIRWLPAPDPNRSIGQLSTLRRAVPRTKNRQTGQLDQRLLSSCASAQDRRVHPCVSVCPQETISRWAEQACLLPMAKSGRGSAWRCHDANGSPFTRPPPVGGAVSLTSRDPGPRRARPRAPPLRSVSACSPSAHLSSAPGPRPCHDA